MGHPRRAIRQSIPHRKAFREKLDAVAQDKLQRAVWNFKNSPTSCAAVRAAMSQIRGLEILNDCNENQKILSKLPDWGDFKVE
ncbi:hypothetical protein N1851_017178 [Merluccius polli]|uniref:Uncharacterized protein n=1 Tax=Merluccius polli TaxID=89951 RepID=A0AA47MQU9_MERPO|nr:hypothetical protein N1851_017178 [Merluccius polli]